MAEPDFYTVPTLAARMGMHPDTLKRRLAALRRDHAMPATLPWSRREHRWSRQAVEAWLRRWQQQAGASPPPPLTPLAIAGRAPAPHHRARA